MKKALRMLVLRMLLLVHPRRSAGACILMYHSVGPNTAVFTTSTTLFEAHLAYIKKKGYEVVFLSELVRRLQAGVPVQNCVVITFDDGYEDAYTNALPLLEKYNLPMSLFVTTGRVGQPQTTTDGVTLPIVSATQLQALTANACIEILPHGHDHIRLDRASDIDAEQEIVRSYEYIAKGERMIPKLYAYASGRYTARTKEILRKNGFEAAVTVTPGIVRQGADLLALPRNAMNAGMGMLDLQAALTGTNEWYEKLKVWRSI